MALILSTFLWPPEPLLQYPCVRAQNKWIFSASYRGSAKLPLHSEQMPNIKQSTCFCSALVQSNESLETAPHPNRNGSYVTRWGSYPIVSVCAPYFLSALQGFLCHMPPRSISMTYIGGIFLANMGGATRKEIP